MGTHLHHNLSKFVPQKPTSRKSKILKKESFGGVNKFIPPGLFLPYFSLKQKLEHFITRTVGHYRFKCWITLTAQKILLNYHSIALLQQYNNVMISRCIGFLLLFIIESLHVLSNSSKLFRFCLVSLYGSG